MLIRNSYHLFNSLTGYPAGYPVIRPAGYPANVPDIRPETGYKKRPDIRPAGYPVQPYNIVKKKRQKRPQTYKRLSRCFMKDDRIHLNLQNFVFCEKKKRRNRPISIFAINLQFCNFFEPKNKYRNNEE